MNKIELQDFNRCNEFYKSVHIITAVKKSISCHQTEGVYLIELTKGEINNLEKIIDDKDIRGVFCSDTLMCYSNYNTVFLKGKYNKSISSNRFGYIHNLQIKDNEILICSTQNDSIFIYDIDKEKLTWEWTAMKNGYNYLVENSEEYIVKNIKEYDKCISLKKKCILLNDKIESREKHRKGLFVNSSYFNKKYVWFTSLNTGYIYRINRVNFSLFKYPIKLKSPHGIHFFDDESFIVTSSEENKIIYLNQNLKYEIIIDNNSDTKIAGISKWLQTTRVYENLLFAIDSISNEIIIIDVENKKYDKIQFNKKWRMHDLFVLNKNFSNILIDTTANNAYKALGDWLLY